MLADCPGAVDELAFFTGFTHPPLPLPVVQRRAEELSRILPAFRDLGVRCGINHLSTVGHLDENLEGSLREPWQHLVDISGAVSASCYCVSDARFQDYVRRCYAALAQAGPDFIWIDDDVRVEGHPAAIRLSCFCAACMERFSASVGVAWDRDSLVAAFAGGERSERLRLRRLWLEHCRAVIARIVALARGGVDSVDPRIPMGLMTGEIPHSGYGFARWAEVLAGPRGRPARWRPGGGFYTDDRPLDLLGKAHSVGRQAGLLPPAVRDIQWEHENFPYQVLKKSRTVFTAEFAAAAGCGCTGVALNIMGTSPDPLDEFRPLLESTVAARPFLDAAVSLFGRSPCEGIWPAFSPDHAAALAPDSDWAGGETWGRDFWHLNELSEIGLPFAYAPEGSRLAVLWGDSPLEWPREALESMLASGVIMDGAAFSRCVDMGLGHLLGFRCTGQRSHDTMERYLPDPLNGPRAGWSRDCRPSFWPQPTYLFEPADPAARPLSEIVDFSAARLGYGSGVFENAAGGRVAVFGYYPWISLQSLAKVSQLRAVCRWLSRDGLPAWVESFHRAAAWCRRDAEGRPCVLLLNASLDEAKGLVVGARSDATRAEMLAADGARSFLPVEQGGGGEACVAVPRLGPWEACVLRL